jgi:hypothetical protein
VAFLQKKIFQLSGEASSPRENIQLFQISRSAFLFCSSVSATSVTFLSIYAVQDKWSVPEACCRPEFPGKITDYGILIGLDNRMKISLKAYNMKPVLFVHAQMVKFLACLFHDQNKV